MALPTRPLGKTGMEITASASGRGQPVALVGPSPGGRRTMSSRYRPSATPWRRGQLGRHRRYIRPRALRRGGRRRHGGHTLADRPYIFTKCGLVWDDSDRYKPALRMGAPDSIRAGAEASLRGLRSMSWTCSRCTGRPTTVPASRTTGGRCSSSKSRARYAPSGSATTTWTAWRRRRLWGTWTPCNHPFQPSADHGD